MPILNIVGQLSGTTGVSPSIAYIQTSDTEAQILASGYLNQAVQSGLVNFSLPCMACVSTIASAGAQPDVGWYEVQYTASGNPVSAVWSLIPAKAPGSVTLPTIANHIATYLDVNGSLGEDASTAINGGNIQAGLSGTAGYLASFPGTASKGSLEVKAVANTGNTVTTISNAAMGQASVVSIPDPAAATANFLLSASAGTQHITAGALQVDAGSISSGLAAGGFVGLIEAFPTTASSGFIAIQGAVNGSGNFGTTISNATTQAQSQVISIPDSGATSANIILSKSVGTQHITSGSLEVDAGSLIAGIATGGTAGGLTLYPATASNGSLVMAPVGNAGNFAATISNISSLGQASIYTMPDPANAAAQFMVGAGATPFVSGNFPKASGTAGLFVDSGISMAPGAGLIGVPYVTTVVISTANVNGAYAAPYQLIAAPGASLAIMVLNAQVITEVVTSAFTAGGVAAIQYGNTVHGAGTIATSATIPAAEITAASSQIYTMAPIAAATVMATATFKNLGLFFSNATQAFATGGTSTVTCVITYVLVPAV